MNIQKKFGVEPLLLCVKMSQLKWFRQFCNAFALGGHPEADPELARDYIRRAIGLAGEKDVWKPSLSLQQM